MKIGKTEALKNILELIPDGAFLLGYRNSLLKQTENRISEFYHITETANSLQLLDPKESVSLCVDSLLKVSVEAVEGKIIIFDEAPLVLEHLLTSSTCKDKRCKIIERLKELLGACAGVVIMSDQLTDKEVALIRELSGIGEENIITAENTYKMPQRTIINYNNEDDWKQSLINDTKRGKKVFIQSDSQALTDRWDLKIEQDINSNLRVLTINSGTLYKKEVSDFLANPNELLNLYDIVICSPTAESGLSIDVRGFFDAIYIDWKHLGLDACEQMMHRVRDEKVPIHLFVYSARNLEVTEDDVTTEARNSSIEAQINYINYRLENDVNFRRDKELEKKIFDSLFEHYPEGKKYRPEVKYLEDLKKKRLWENHNFKYLLSHSLRERGYEVLEAETLEVNKEEISTWEQSEEIKDKRTELILNARDLTEDEFKARDKKEAKTPVEVGENKRYLLKQQFPDIDKKPIFNHDFIREVTQNDKDKLGKVKLRQQFEDKELNDLLSKKKKVDLVNNNYLYPDIDKKPAIANALREVISPEIFERDDLHDSCPLVLNVIEKAKKMCVLPKQKKLSNMKHLGVLLELIGYGLSGKQIRDGDDRKRFYEVVDRLIYEEVIDIDKKGNPVTEARYIYPQLKDCLETRRKELFEKYDKAYFEGALAENNVTFKEVTKICFKRDRPSTLSLASQSNNEVPIAEKKVLDSESSEVKVGQYIDGKDGSREVMQCEVVEVLRDKVLCLWGFAKKEIYIARDQIRAIWENVPLDNGKTTRRKVWGA